MGYSINQRHGNYNIQRRVTAVRYIVVHYVGAGTSAVGNALANCRYFAGGNRNASAHYFIDDGSIYEYADPTTYATWHCGDGRGRYGITNQNSVGIEVCNNGGPYTGAETDRLAWLVQKLMSDFGVSADHVVRHYDASRKECPLYYVQNPGAWTELHARITGGKVTGGDAPASRFGDTNWTGPLMVSEWQRQRGTTVDGKISGQSTYNANTLQWAITVSPAENGRGGSSLIWSVQRFLNAKGYDCGAPDGHMGANTIKAVQRYVRDVTGIQIAIDGYWGHDTSRAFAVSLEKGAWRG